MDQRIAVDAFKRGADQQRGLAGNAEHGRALDHQERPQALAAAEARITHCVHQSLGAGDLIVQDVVRQQASEQGLGVVSGLVQTLGEIGRGRAGHQERLQD
ncbi:hypothetical protein ACVIIW_002185 [Bradyrhizobium sp. USDA 4449]